MPGARWFEGARLNYAEHLLTGDDDAVAVVARSQTRDPIELTFGELREQVARARAGLQRLGVGPGDRVVGYLPNVPEALVAFIATASLGAIWASCAPEFGPRSVLDRIAQIEPKVLLAVAGYTYRDREVDRRAEVAAIREGLPTLEHVVHVPYGAARPARRHRLERAAGRGGPAGVRAGRRSTTRSTCCSPPAPPACRRRSCTATAGCSSSTSRPRASAGTSSPATRLLQFTTTAWMMWNALVSALLLRASIVMIDGDPAWPGLDYQWRLAAETRATHIGVAPVFLMRCRKAGVADRRADLRIASSSPPARRCPPRASTTSTSSSAPTCCCSTAAAGPTSAARSSPGTSWRPSTRARSPAAASGVDAKAFDVDGNEVVGELGELVITRADAVDARGLLERPGRRALPRVLLRALPRRLAPGRLGRASPSAAAASSPAARTRRSTAAACASARASSTRSSRSCPRSPTA